jgi:hypothetical protein
VDALASRSEKDRPLLAAATTLCCAIVALVFSLWFYGGPAASRQSGDKSRRAALAFRDRVPAYQELVSSTLARSLFADEYDRFEYITQSKRGETHQLRETLEELLEEYEVVDLFLLSHSNYFVFDIASLDWSLTQRLRFVYDTGCADLELGRVWLRLGANAFVGHAAERSLSPLFFLYFARRWIKGVHLDEAVEEANSRSLSRLETFGLTGLDISAEGTIIGDHSVWIGGP